jgi:hypothetical protein
MDDSARLIVGIFLFLGVLGDGALSGISFLELIGADNGFSIVLSITGGLLITACTASTKFMLQQGSVVLVMLWCGAVLIDVVTTIFGIAEFIGFNNILAPAMVAFVQGSALAFSFIIDDGY